MRQFYTYLHCKPDGTPFYVGKGCSGVNWYRRSHSLTSGRSRHHKNVVKKYGKNNILVFVFPCESEEQALSDEILQIAQLRSDGCSLVNVTDGGEGTVGLKWAEESRAKLARHTKSEEHRRKISQALTGKPLSEEAKRKMAATKTGVPSPKRGTRLTVEHRAKISESWKTRIVTDETRAKQSASLTGIKHADSFESKATKDVIDQVVLDYQSGASLPSLEKKYRTSHKTLRKILIGNGVTIRSSRFVSRSTMSS
jgi:hypothetical protein